MDSITFWCSPAMAWPIPTTGVVFLAEALSAIGHAIYGDAWHGSEPALDGQPSPLLPEDWRTATGAQRQYGEALLRTLRDESPSLTRVHRTQAVKTAAPIPPPPSGRRVDTTTTITLRDVVTWADPNEWALARRRAQESHIVVDGAQRRWHRVLNTACLLFKAGALETVLRDYDGGPYIKPPPDLWNTEPDRVRQRFTFCQVDLARPFAQTYAMRPSSAPNTAYRFHLIFVTAKSLASSLRLIAKIARPTVGDDSRPPKLSLVKLEEYKNGIKAAVRASPDAPPLGWGREETIRRGRVEWRLPVDAARSGRAEALREVAEEGVDHKWSTRRGALG